MIRTTVVLGSFFVSAMAMACPGAKCDDKGNCARCAEHVNGKKGEKKHECKEGCKDHAHHAQHEGTGHDAGHGCKDKTGGKFCHDDAAKICGKEVLKSHDKIHVCLLANKEKISKECAKHLETEKH